MRHVQHDMSCRAQRRELIVQLDGVRQQLVAADFFPAGSPDVELLTEMAVFGDAGCFLDQARLYPERACWRLSCCVYYRIAFQSPCGTARNARAITCSLLTCRRLLWGCKSAFVGYGAYGITLKLPSCWSAGGVAAVPMPGQVHRQGRRPWHRDRGPPRLRRRQRVLLPPRCRAPGETGAHLTFVTRHWLHGNRPRPAVVLLHVVSDRQAKTLLSTTWHSMQSAHAR